MSVHRGRPEVAVIRSTDANDPERTWQTFAAIRRDGARILASANFAGHDPSRYEYI
jgi:hypothetical protein